jgi:hypothetical protein
MTVPVDAKSNGAGRGQGSYSSLDTPTPRAPVARGFVTVKELALVPVMLTLRCFLPGRRRTVGAIFGDRRDKRIPLSENAIDRI